MEHRDGGRRGPRPLPCLVTSEIKVTLSRAGVRFFITCRSSTTRRLAMISFSGTRKPSSEVGLRIITFPDGQMRHRRQYPKCRRLRKGFLIMCRLMSGMRIRPMAEWHHGAPAFCNAGMAVPFFSLLDCFGRILNALREGPNGPDTIVVFSSDHGYHFGEKDHWHKFTLWERSTRIPASWEEPVPIKSVYEFNPLKYTWRLSGN